MRRIARRGWRQLSVLAALLLALAYLIHSLFVMQVLQAGNVQMLAQYRDEVSSPQTEQPVRGTIVDANGLPLVNTVTVFKLGAYPYLVTNKAQAARAITNIIFPLPQVGTPRALAAARKAQQKHYARILHKLNETQYNYVCLAGDDSYTCPLQDDISTQQANEVSNLKMAGFDLEARNRPNYPNGPVAAHVLGFVNYTYPKGQAVDQGQYGLEEYYNSLLRGIAGHVAVRQDTQGDTIRVGPGSNTAAQQGAQLRLYLDSYIQYKVEHILFQTIQSTGAHSGTVVVERPSDGAILAMASWPRYDPGKWQDILKADPTNGFNRFKNPAISDEYEPGSTFKSLLTAVGFDSGSFNASTVVEDTGSYTTDGFTIQNWCLAACDYNASGSYGGTVQDMLHWSSNIAATKFSKMIPDVTFYKYLDAFGFGQPTGVDLAGEVPGDVRKPTDEPPKPIWVPAYKDTTAYGQGIAVTPLQMANAYAVLTNGGKLMVPHVVQSYTLDGKTTVIAPQVKRQVISPDTAQVVSDILVHATINGEACEALVPGYDVAAKTGTTSLYNGSSATISSTAAYGPTNLPANQQFVVLVVLDQPNNPYGSETAAPAVHTILQTLFSYYHLQPNQGDLIQPNKMCSGPLSPT